MILYNCYDPWSYHFLIYFIVNHFKGVEDVTSALGNPLCRHTSARYFCSGPKVSEEPFVS